MINSTPVPNNLLNQKKEENSLPLPLSRKQPNITPLPGNFAARSCFLFANSLLNTGSRPFLGQNRLVSSSDLGPNTDATRLEATSAKIHGLSIEEICGSGKPGTESFQCSAMYREYWEQQDRTAKRLDNTHLCAKSAEWNSHYPDLSYQLRLSLCKYKGSVNHQGNIDHRTIERAAAVVKEVLDHQHSKYADISQSLREYAALLWLEGSLPRNVDSAEQILDHLIKIFPHLRNTE